MIKTLFLSFILLASVPALAVEDIHQAISKLTPSLPQESSRSLAIHIDKFSKEYGIDWAILVAIFKQESNFKISAVNYKSRDFGIGQLHYKNIIARGVDIGRLLTDSEYAIQETAKFLNELKAKYAKIDSKNGRKWYTRYHSFTPSLRTNYRTLLSEHLKITEEVRNGRKTKKTDQRIPRSTYTRN